MQIEKGFTDNWLQPTGAQENLMRQYAGCKRFVWNRALSIEQARYRRGEKKLLGKYEMMKQLTKKRFLSSNKGLALLASGYRASVNSLPSGRSWDSTMKQEPIEEAALCAQPQ
jgi:hypothetical protein